MTDQPEDFGKRLEDKRIIELISKAMQEVFATNVEEGKFIDVSRIPLICQSIVGIHDKMESIEDKLDKKFVTQDAFNPIKNIVYGAVAIILTTVLGWVLFAVHK